MKMKAGNARANLVKAISSAAISVGAPSAAPIYMTPNTKGMRKAATNLFIWFEGVLMKALNDRLINGPNCLKNGDVSFNYLMLLPVKVVEFYW
jgi:hypothetical protein